MQWSTYQEQGPGLLRRPVHCLSNKDKQGLGLPQRYQPQPLPLPLSKHCRTLKAHSAIWKKNTFFPSAFSQLSTASTQSCYPAKHYCSTIPRHPLPTHHTLNTAVPATLLTLVRFLQLQTKKPSTFPSYTRLPSAVYTRCNLFLRIQHSWYLKCGALSPPLLLHISVLHQPPLCCVILYNLMQNVVQSSNLFNSAETL